MLELCEAERKVQPAVLQAVQRDRGGSIHPADWAQEFDCVSNAETVSEQHAIQASGLLPNAAMQDTLHIWPLMRISSQSQKDTRHQHAMMVMFEFVRCGCEVFLCECAGCVCQVCL